MLLLCKSGWQDSNLRPSGPKPDAITGLRYTPNNFERTAKVEKKSAFANVILNF